MLEITEILEILGMGFTKELPVWVLLWSVAPTCTKHLWGLYRTRVFCMEGATRVHISVLLWPMVPYPYISPRHRHPVEQVEQVEHVNISQT